MKKTKKIKNQKKRKNPFKKKKPTSFILEAGF